MSLARRNAWSSQSVVIVAGMALSLAACSNFENKPSQKMDGGAPTDAASVDLSPAPDLNPGTAGTVGSGGVGAGGLGAGGNLAGGSGGGTAGGGGQSLGGMGGGEIDPGSATCAQGMKRCEGLQPQVCDAAGTWQDAGGRCPFVCNAASGTCGGACSPGALQCSGLQPQVCDATGTWANSGVACASVCNSGNCAACAAGAKQCNGLQPQLCDAAGAWQNMGTPCPFVCSATAGTCAGTCTPGAKQCSALQPQVCDATGSWKNMGTACASVCNGGTCAACTAGAKQCNGLQPQLCDAAGAWQNMGTSCPFVCNAAAGTCAGTCTPGAKQCTGLQPQVCDANGTWQNMGTACPYVCSGTSGTCTGGCVPGAKQCSGLQPQVCDAAGVWQNSGAACQYVCGGGACSGSCTPNAKQCSGLQPQVCSAAGVWQNSGAACPNVCKASTGTCSGVCMPNAKQCSGTQPQVCDTAGAWQNNGAACGTCAPCSLATGTCVAAIGMDCNDNNACTKGETCQASGLCGGGTSMSGMGCGTTCKPGTISCSTGAPVCIQSDADRGVTCGNKLSCDGSGNCKCRQKGAWNLLANPGFDSDVKLGSWNVSTGAAWDAKDVESCAMSGSAKLQSGRTMQQCVGVDPARVRTYFYGFMYVATDYASADCRVQPFKDGACSVESDIQSFANVYHPGPSNTPEWQTMNGSDDIPADSHSLLITCVGEAPATPIYYDRLYISTAAPSGPSPQF